MPHPIRAAYTIPWGAQFGAARAGGKRRHNGTDYHCPIGTPVYGTGTGGVVTHIGYNGDPWMGLGHNISIRYPDGTTIDGHMRHRTPLQVGSRVGPDTVIGYVGLTGNAVNASPPGSHTHHERRKTNGLLVNPALIYGAQTATASTTGTQIGDALSAAEVTEIKTFITTEINRLAGYVRREARARLFQNSVTGKYMIADPDGVYLDTDIEGEGEIASLKASGYLLIASEEIPQQVDQQRWDNIIAKIEATRAAVRGGSSTPAAVDVSAIAEAVLAALGPQLTAINANIDDQPTTFTVSPQ